jgi:hypothetical protein
MRILVIVENADDTVLLVLSLVFRSPRFQPPNWPNLGLEFVYNDWLTFPGEISG